MEKLNGKEIRFEIKERESYLEVLNILVNIKSNYDGFYDVRTVEGTNYIIITIDDAKAESIEKHPFLSSFILDIEDDIEIVTIIPKDLTSKAKEELDDLDFNTYLRVEF